MARNILTGNARKEDEGSARQLLIRCLELLDKERYPHIATSAHYMLSDIFIPDDIDPGSVDSSSDDDETASAANPRKNERKRKSTCTAATASSSTAMVAIKVGTLAILKLINLNSLKLNTA